MAGHSRYSGTLRGGNVWSKSEFAPKIQNINRAEDIGTQGNFETPVFKWSKVGDSAPGGDKHDAVRREVFEEMFATRARRAKAIVDEEERMENIRRNQLMKTIAGFVSETSQTVQETVQDLPGVTTKLFKQTFFPDAPEDTTVYCTVTLALAVLVRAEARMANLKSRARLD